MADNDSATVPDDPTPIDAQDAGVAPAAHLKEEPKEAVKPVSIAAPVNCITQEPDVFENDGWELAIMQTNFWDLLR